MKKIFKKNPLHINHLYGYILFAVTIFLNSTVVMSQEFPTQFPWIADTVYISGEANGGGDGSLLSPYNSWDNFSFKSKTAYLFKRGGQMDIEEKIVIRADSIFFGGYGSGDRPHFNGKTTNKHLYFCGTQQYIQGINIQCLDTGTCVTFAGNSDMFLWADSMELSHAWWGTNPGGYGKIILSNLYVHRTRVDGIYAAHNDTLIIRNTKVHDVNRWYEHIQDINTSGGDCVQGESNDYVEISGCTLDHSSNPGKFALILNGADTAIIKNSTLAGFDLSATVYIGGSKRGWHFDGCKILGGKTGLWNHGELVVKNCVFKSQWGNAILGPKGIICNSTFTDNPGGREYYDSQGNINVTRGIVLPISGNDTRLKIYNNIFYNVNQSIECFTEYINNTIMVYNNNYYNDPALFENHPKSQLGENVFNVDPLFNNSKGDATDFYLSEGSSLIDAGLDLSTVDIIVATDINGFARPNGAGYDIGAYEYYKVDPLKIEEVVSTKNSISTFPNPSSGKYTVRSVAGNIRQIKVFSLLGKKVLDIKVSNLSEYYLDLTELPSGSYILRVLLEDETCLQKVLKM